jgi:predicted RNA-binding protein YlxR (DUF448 family)
MPIHSSISAVLKRAEKMKRTDIERTCFACNGKDRKENLMRWVAVSGKILPDWLQRIDSRSIYTHYSQECVSTLLNSRKLPEKFFPGTPFFEIGREQIFSFIKERTIESINYFMSICRKSGVVFKGQNLIMDKAKKGQRFKYIICANDVSQNTVTDVERVTGMHCFKAGLDKSAVGAMFDGRPAGVFALVESAQSEKLFFYMNLLEKFISGDKYAH